MLLLKVKILKSIKGIAKGYGPAGSAQNLVQSVYDFISVQPEEHQEGWALLFDVLCTTNPSAVTGGSWHGLLVGLAKEVSSAPREKPAGGMTLQEMADLRAEKQAAGLAPADTASPAHAAIIAGAGVDLPEPTPNQQAAADAAEAAEDAAAGHALVIETAAQDDAANEPPKKSAKKTKADKARDMLANAQE